MKLIIQTIAFLLISIQAFSKCTGSAFYVWPTGETCSQNSVFVLEGYARTQEIIKGLGTKFKVYLISNKEKVELTLQNILVGQHSLTQAILKPTVTLSEEIEYTLSIENLGELKNLLYDSYSEENKQYKWKVIKVFDNIAPKWINKPMYENSSFAMYGCGPAEFVNFKLAVDDESNYLVKTTVKNLSTGKESSYYLRVGELIAIGRSMCSGAFTFSDGEKYEVEFDLFDASGNVTKWTDERIEFESPRKGN